MTLQRVRCARLTDGAHHAVMAADRQRVRARLGGAQRPRGTLKAVQHAGGRLLRAPHACMHRRLDRRACLLTSFWRPASCDFPFGMNLSPMIDWSKTALHCWAPAAVNHKQAHPLFLLVYMSGASNLQCGSSRSHAAAVLGPP